MSQWKPLFHTALGWEPGTSRLLSLWSLSISDKLTGLTYFCWTFWWCWEGNEVMNTWGNYAGIVLLKLWLWGMSLGWSEQLHILSPTHGRPSFIPWDIYNRPRPSVHGRLHGKRFRLLCFKPSAVHVPGNKIIRWLNPCTISNVALAVRNTIWCHNLHKQTKAQITPAVG